MILFYLIDFILFDLIVRDYENVSNIILQFLNIQVPG